MVRGLRGLTLGLGLVLAAGLIFGYVNRGSGSIGLLASPLLPDLAARGPAPEFRGIVGWENSPPLTMAQLRGKVVLVDFWTYSCINCQRTFPFVRQWYEKYANAGLVIVGVHSPEFEFEKNREGVREAIRTYGIKWPVAVDSNMKTWDAYNNAYWPAGYLVDRSGQIRYVHFGEGEYDRTERVIRSLLQEPGAKAEGPLISKGAGRRAS